MNETADTKPTHCVLEHRMFALFQDPVFRRADTDGTPVMAVRLGDRDAAMPLRSLQREFGIGDSTHDGTVLAAIAEALDFVPILRLGDPLPPEILTGDASWEPGPTHQRLALIRLQMQLVAWLHGGDGAEPIVLDAAALAGLEDDPVLRQQIQEAFQRAAESLGLPSKDAVIEQMESLAFELAFIESLRERLLELVRQMARRLERLSRGFRGDTEQRATLDRLRHLSGEALRQISHRFEQQDAQAGEVMAALRHLESHRHFIRANRDWLYRSHMAWEPLLADWDKAGEALNEPLRALLARTYQFLAPRFMPVTEWLKHRKTNPKPGAGPRMEW